MKKLIFVLIIALAPGCFKAQTVSPGDKAFIEVTGVHEMEVAPDEIFISITLQELPDKKEKSNIKRQEDSLKACIKQLGIDLSNLTINRADADYRKIRKSTRDVVLSKTYTLKVTNTDILNKLYLAFDRIDVMDAFVMRISHSRMQELTKECRIKAIKAAKEKSEYLLSAIGKNSGNPLEVRENQTYAGNEEPYARFRRSGAYANSVNYDSVAAPEEELSFTKIKIRSEIWAKFEIINK